MENNILEKTQQEEPEKKPLKIEFSGEEFLKTAAQWGQFIAIFNFVGVGFLLVMAILMIALGSTLQEYQDFAEYPLGLMGGLYIIMAVIYFFPAYFLSRSCSNIKEAFLNRNESVLTKAFEYLKSMSLFLGILYIISLLILVFAIVIMVFFIGSMVALF